MAKHGLQRASPVHFSLPITPPPTSGGGVMGCHVGSVGMWPHFTPTQKNAPLPLQQQHEMPPPPTPPK